MKKIFAVAVFATMTMLGTTAAGAGNVHSHAGSRAGGPPEPQPGAQSGVQPGVQSGTASQQPAKAPRQVSEDQYKILLNQCRYADTQEAREQCRADVAEQYRVGKHDPTLDCRAYSGVTVCGELKLSEREQACVQESVQGGMTHRRAEVECYAFR
ncbi:hypothetical protein ACFHYQ_17980 [Sphaerimonospora cavernae]|uniref:Uncharacterized protein n=1 Tax=Sphaerimonospora cavernae TaxID=1740611 RepID=A0ABV6U6V3_9ACTN